LLAFPWVAEKLTPKWVDVVRVATPATKVQKKRLDGTSWLDVGSIVFALALACGAGYWLIDLVRPERATSKVAESVGRLSGPPRPGSCWSIPDIGNIGDPAELSETACAVNPSVWQVVETSPCPAVQITAELVINGAPSEFEFCLVQFPAAVPAAPAVRTNVGSGGAGGEGVVEFG
jgi:hypothetical protein